MTSSAFPAVGSATSNSPRQSELSLSFRYRLSQSPFYEQDEQSQLLVSIDGVLVGVSPQ